MSDYLISNMIEHIGAVQLKTPANTHQTSKLAYWKLTSALTSAAMVGALVFGTVGTIGFTSPAHAGTCSGVAGGPYTLPTQNTPVNLASDCGGGVAGQVTVTGNITGNNTAPLIRDNRNSQQNWTIVVNPGVTVEDAVNAGTGAIELRVDGATIDNAGTISAPTVASTAINLQNADTTIINRATGTISATRNGINFFNGDFTLNNDGQINRISMQTVPNMLIENAGTITGGNSDAIVINLADSDIIRNSGTIDADNANRVAINYNNGAGDAAILENSGTIIGGSNQRAIFFNAGLGNHAGNVTNSGTITGGALGAIQFTGANDRLELQPGSMITGDVNANAGTDVFVLGGTGNQAIDVSLIDGNNTDNGEQYLRFETFIKEDASTWTLTGNNTEINNWAVNGGTLVVNGTMNSTLFSVNGGTLGGSGTTGSLTVNNGGTLAPGNSIGTINTGNLTLGPGSTLLIEVSQAGADQVNVTGTVDVSGSTLQVDDFAPALQDVNQTFVIVNNDGTDAVTGTFGTITDNLAFLTPSVIYNGGTNSNDILLSFTTSSFTTLPGMDENETSVSKGLDNLGTTTGSDGKALRDLITPLTNAQALTTFEDLAGEIHVSSVHTIQDVAGNIDGQISGRFANLTQSGTSGGFGYSSARQALDGKLNNQSYFATDLAADAALAEASDTRTLGSEEFGYGYSSVATDDIQYWGGVSGFYSNTETDGNANGVSAQGFGFTLGGDKAISAATTLGLAFSYADALTRTDDGLSTLNIDSYSMALYGLHTADNDVQFSGSMGYHYHTINGSRQISNIGLTANSDYHAHQLTFQSEVSKRYVYDDNKDIIPFIQANASYLSTSAFTETGAGGANLISTGESHFNLDLVLGARMDIELEDDAKLMFGGGYAHRIGNDAHDANYAFAGGGSFTTKGTTRQRNSLYLVAGFERAFSDNATFFAKSSASFANDHQSYNGSIGLKVKF